LNSVIRLHYFKPLVGLL